MAGNKERWSVEGPDRSAIAIGFHQGGTGWATLHYGNGQWIPDIPLSTEDVQRLREAMAQIGQKMEVG